MLNSADLLVLTDIGFHTYSRERALQKCANDCQTLQHSTTLSEARTLFRLPFPKKKREKTLAAGHPHAPVVAGRRGAVDLPAAAAGLEVALRSQGGDLFFSFFRSENT